MLFPELMKSQLPEELRGDVDRLLELKINSPEIREIPRVEAINAYLDSFIIEIKSVLQSMDNVS